MKLEGNHQFKVARERLFEALLDPEVLARTMPGCEQLERTGEHSFRGELSVAIGPVKGKFRGTLELFQVDPPNGYHMVLNGQGPSGFMKGEGDITLAEADGGTLLTYALEAQVGGRMAAVGQRLMDSSTKVIAQQGLEGLAAQVEIEVPAAALESVGEGAQNGSRGEPVSAAARAAAPAAPSQAQMAGRFAGGLWREMLPVPVRAAFWLVLGVAAGWWLRGCSL